MIALSLLFGGCRSIDYSESAKNVNAGSQDLASILDEEQARRAKIEEQLRLNQELARLQEQEKSFASGDMASKRATPVQAKPPPEDQAVVGQATGSLFGGLLGRLPLRTSSDSVQLSASTLNKPPPPTRPRLKQAEPQLASSSSSSVRSVRIPKPRPNFGNAFLVAPQNMDEFESYTVTLKVSDQEIAKFMDKLKERDPQLAAAATPEVLLSNFIRVELLGDDFKIEPKDKSLSMHKVDTRTGQVADWVWVVSPQTWGKNKKLTAHIYSLEDSKGDFVLKELATKNLEVSVAVSPFDGSIKAIAQLILLPLAGWGSKQGWDWFKNRKRAPANTTESSPLPAIPPAEEEAPRQAA